MNVNNSNRNMNQAGVNSFVNNKPKVTGNLKQDRIGSKTAPIETDFVNNFFNFRVSE